MTEAQLLAEIITFCEEHRLVWHSCGDSRLCRGKRGFPDIVVAGQRGILFRELKSERGETSAEQDRWGWTIESGGGRWSVWRPRDWTSGAIRTELNLIA